MTAWYNEIDPFKAEWLRELIRRSLIAPGDVDERSIADVRPAELLGYAQCHFFAGIGVWSYALRCAGWSDERPAWTASTPCPSFSAAGKGLGFSDPRHLWPEVERLARVHRPPVLFGEQVASAIGHGWLDLVQADLEALDYAVGKAVLGACSVGAPHIRQRLYFVAESCGERTWREAANEGRPGGTLDRESRRLASTVGADSRTGLLVDPTGRGCGIGGDAAQPGRRPDRRTADGRDSETLRPSPLNGFWRDADWIGCRDGRWRPVEPGTFPLVAGATGRVGRLRGYGDSIVGPAAQAFIEAYIETERV